MSERRWRHVAFSICTGVALLLCAAAAVAWILSYRTHFAGIVITSRPEKRSVTRARVHLTRGGLSYFREQDVYGALDPDETRRQWNWATSPATDYPGRDSLWRRAQINRAGFAYLQLDFVLPPAEDPRSQLRAHWFAWVVPMWVVWLLTAVPAALGVRGWLRRARRRRRLSRGLCPTCGYDVKPSESTSCPECGTNLTPKAPLAAASSP